MRVCLTVSEGKDPSHHHTLGTDAEQQSARVCLTKGRGDKKKLIILNIY